MKKIPTVFKRIFDGHKIIDILPEITEGCETAFLCGDATVKFDGSPIAIINGKIYKRFDLKPGISRTGSRAALTIQRTRGFTKHTTTTTQGDLHRLRLMKQSESTSTETLTDWKKTRSKSTEKSCLTSSETSRASESFCVRIASRALYSGSAVRRFAKSNAPTLALIGGRRNER